MNGQHIKMMVDRITAAKVENEYLRELDTTDKNPNFASGLCTCREYRWRVLINHTEYSEFFEKLYKQS